MTLRLIFALALSCIGIGSGALAYDGHFTLTAENAGKGLGNPFKGKTAQEIHDMFIKRAINRVALIHSTARMVT
jgi:hypothetical protein